jgi:hypothetical protein
VEGGLVSSTLAVGGAAGASIGAGVGPQLVTIPSITNTVVRYTTLFMRKPPFCDL